MKPHFMISDCDGGLYDTRATDWSKSPPLRANFSRHHTEIKTVADLKATLRAGSHAWPGGYPLYFLTHDGAALSFDAARAEFRNIAHSIQNDISDGWRIVGCAVNYENADLICDHTGNPIPSAHGEAE